MKVPTVVSDELFLECQKYEFNAWNNNPFSYDLQHSGEVKKQNYYMEKMGLTFGPNGKINVNGSSILDLGGGPCSLLLRTENFSKAVVIDPLCYPEHILKRYQDNSILYVKDKGENVCNHFSDKNFDECWMYNVLEHVQDVKKILNSVSRIAKILRIFDWIEFPPYEGHPQFLTEDIFLKNIAYKSKSVAIDNFNVPHLLVGKFIAGIFYL